jgi:hypothetical protein
LHVVVELHPKARVYHRLILSTYGEGTMYICVEHSYHVGHYVIEGDGEGDKMETLEGERVRSRSDQQQHPK